MCPKVDLKYGDMIMERFIVSSQSESLTALQDLLSYTSVVGHSKVKIMEIKRLFFISCICICLQPA